MARSIGESRVNSRLRCGLITRRSSSAPSSTPRSSSSTNFASVLAKPSIERAWRLAVFMHAFLEPRHFDCDPHDFGALIQARERLGFVFRGEDSILDRQA